MIHVANSGPASSLPSDSALGRLNTGWTPGPKEGEEAVAAPGGPGPSRVVGVGGGPSGAPPAVPGGGPALHGPGPSQEEALVGAELRPGASRGGQGGREGPTPAPPASSKGGAAARADFGDGAPLSDAPPGVSPPTVPPAARLDAAVDA